MSSCFQELFKETSSMELVKQIFEMMIYIESYKMIYIQSYKNV